MYIIKPAQVWSFFLQSLVTFTSVMHIHLQSCFYVVQIINKKSSERANKIDDWLTFLFLFKYFWHQRSRHIAAATCLCSKLTTALPNFYIFRSFSCLLPLYRNASLWEREQTKIIQKMFFYHYCSNRGIKKSYMLFSRVVREI